MVDNGAYGRRSDGGIFKDSLIGIKFDADKMNVPPPTQIVDTNNYKFPYVLVGDEAFPLKHYLMRPYPRNNLNLERRVYNYRLSRARRLIENSFGILASKWRIFRKPIEANVSTVESIVQATVCLHNFFLIIQIFYI